VSAFPSSLKFLLGTLSVFLAILPVAAKPLDDTSLSIPAPGDYALRVLSPAVLEVVLISSPAADTRAPDVHDQFHRDDFHVTVDGAAAPVASIGFKRRVRYAPLKPRDLRVATSIYLELKSPLPSDGVHQVAVSATSSEWPSGVTAEVATEPSRYSPAIHVNQEGYEPAQPKVAFVGYYLGTLGELPIPADAGFDVVTVEGEKTVFHGRLLQRRDIGFTYSPRPYQQVYEADFTDVKQPGVYRLRVAGLGTSLSFRIAEGEAMNLARAYELGLYEQRCGTTNALPFTRFTHDACHTDRAAVPEPADRFPKAWQIIRDLAKDQIKSERLVHQLKDSDDQYYPFVRGGSIDVAGGHHDAGDYSKYTINSAALVHELMFAVDSLPGVAELDNLGIPESGDGVSDVMQEAKWEADFLAKMQDDDGGFYFLVYPRDRRYEDDVLPEHGDPQIVWPKNTAATAAAVAALAQCASSPAFKKQYAEDAKRYLAQAEKGWAFLQKAIAAHGRAGAYQRLTHYGDYFADDDELAWAACELFVATGADSYRAALRQLYPNPADPSRLVWSWGHAQFSYGNALRSYAFAARSGRLKSDQLDADYLAKCESELRKAGDDALRWSEHNAYGTSFPEPTKRQLTAGWYFSSEQAFDLTVAFQLSPRPEYARAALANLNYELGGNPVNVCFVTGLGQRRQHEIVSQYAENDQRRLPPSGLPLGNIQGAFEYLGLYKTQLREASVPLDDAHPPFAIYDRWSDTYNVTAEYTIATLGRSLATAAYWAAQTPLKTQAWKSAKATIAAPTHVAALNRPIEFKLDSPELDLADARIVWEGRDQEPALGATFTYVPHTAGAQWVEAEAALPDGRRVFARTEFSSNAPVVLWIDGELPRGAQPSAEHGDNWGWIKAATKPRELASHLDRPQHESALASGIHEHGFNNAEATLTLDPGDVLFAYVFIDPAHPPKTIMLEWNDGSNEHRAFWGPNLIPYGHMDTASQRLMGPVPPAGRWVRLDVPASAVGLEGHTIKGMVFRLYDGRVRWDAAGKMSRSVKELGTFHVPESN
jgi:hypothetical protein